MTISHSNRDTTFFFFFLLSLFLCVTVDEEDEVTIAHAAKLIADAIGFQGALKFDTTAADGQIKKTASNAKLRSLMKEKFQFTPLEVAIRDTVSWFEQNYHQARL